MKWIGCVCVRVRVCVRLCSTLFNLVANSLRRITWHLTSHYSYRNKCAPAAMIDQSSIIEGIKMSSSGGLIAGHLGPY